MKIRRHRGFSTGWLMLVMLGGVLAVGRAADPVAIPSHPLNVLFVGNSYTQVNSLPTIFQSMAVSAGYPKPETASITPGGFTFVQHLQNPKTLELIDGGASAGSKWDVVVLQEQSQTPALAEGSEPVRQSFLAGAVGLSKRIQTKNPAARLLFYETWARRSDLWQKSPKDVQSLGSDAADMQRRLTKWYEKAASSAAQLYPVIGPAKVWLGRVGDLWLLNFKNPQPLVLHGADGSHPSFAGSYLAGLVIFANVYGVVPDKVTFKGSLSEADAVSLRKLVASHHELAPCGVKP